MGLIQEAARVLRETVQPEAPEEPANAAEPDPEQPSEADEESEPETEMVAEVEDSEQTEDRTDDLPENFKSVAALVKSYRHAERKIREQAEELKQLREASYELDPETLRETLAEHRQMFLLGLQAEAERLLAIDSRISIAERAALRQWEGSQ